MRSFAFVLLAGVFCAACSSSNSSGGGGSDAGEGGAVADSNPPGSDASVTTAQACMSEAGAPSPSEFTDVPTCMPHECVLTGSLNGASVITTYVPAAFTFTNGSSFDTDFGLGGHIHIAFSGMIADGMVADATSGTVLTPSDWAYDPGASATICAGDGTRIMPTTVDGGGTQVQFILRCMAGGCDGGAGIDGALTGCCLP